MKKLILVFLLSVLMVSNSFALVVIYDSNSDAVFSISEKDDTVVPPGCSKTFLPGGWDVWELPAAMDYLKFRGNKFIVDTEKMAREEEDRRLKKIEQDKVKENRHLAMKKLKTEFGLTDDQISALFDSGGKNEI